MAERALLLREQGVDYWLEARPTPEFFGGNSPDEIAPELRELVLFAFGFALEGDVPNLALIRRDVQDAVRVGLRFATSFSSRGPYGMDLVLADPIVSPGSIEITLPVVHMALQFGDAWPSVALAVPVSTAVGGYLAVAIDKVTGGVLSEVGKQIAGGVLARISTRIPGSGVRTQKSIRDSLFDPEVGVQEAIGRLRQEHGCRHAALLESAVSDGGRLRYKYVLRQCLDSIAPDVVATVFVPRRSDGVPEIKVEPLHAPPQVTSS